MVGVIVSPLLFWIVIGAGFGSSLHTGATGTGSFLVYFFPGALIMIVLFTSIFTMMSVIEDRNEGFLLSVMVAPVHGRESCWARCWAVPRFPLFRV